MDLKTRIENAKQRVIENLNIVDSKLISIRKELALSDTKNICLNSLGEIQGSGSALDVSIARLMTLIVIDNLEK